MSLFALVIIPILFGLVGFFEPCSLGANLIFLNRTHKLSKGKRVWESVVFTSVRAIVLAVVGLAAAFIGGKFIEAQSTLFVVLGVGYILLGILAIINMYKPLFNVNLNFARFIKNRGSVSLGVLFGLIIPACAIAFIVALIGRAVIAGNLFEGFISLLVFGIALSAPLIFLSYFEKSNRIVQRWASKANKMPWLAGAILIVVGILTLLSSVWWSGALALI